MSLKDSNSGIILHADGCGSKESINSVSHTVLRGSVPVTLAVLAASQLNARTHMHILSHTVQLAANHLP